MGRLSKPANAAAVIKPRSLCPRMFDPPGDTKAFTAPYTRQGPKPDTNKTKEKTSCKRQPTGKSGLASSKKRAMLNGRSGGDRGGGEVRAMLILMFILGGVGMRFLPHAWNFTPVIAMLLLAGCYMKARQLWVPIVALMA
ncbi:MAG: DUF6580 family putative transport protein, partial [Terriglobales bacterium]